MTARLGLGRFLLADLELGRAGAPAGAQVRRGWASRQPLAD